MDRDVLCRAGGGATDGGQDARRGGSPMHEPTYRAFKYTEAHRNHRAVGTEADSKREPERLCSVIRP